MRGNPFAGGSAWMAVATVLATAGLLNIAAPPRVVAQEVSTAKFERLTVEQRRTYDAWRLARKTFEIELDAYWASVNTLRDLRRRKRSASQPFTLADYVATQPPRYTGPTLPEAIAKILAEPEPDAKPVPPAPVQLPPGVDEFRAAAKAAYRFMPEATTEAEFKRRYAVEALAIGLTKDQVVKVYALETGGNGTYDMQAGIHPQKRTGIPISSALGYAQLLAGNSVNELVKHGDGFIRRLEAMAAVPQPATSLRRQTLRNKAAVLRAMLKDARQVPNEWSDHVRFGTTPKGLAIHALNLDADIGPWLQVIKLKGLKDTAATEAGRTNLSGPEIELMNLAGPRTGLEMLQPIAAKVPTTNFFARAGYERNSVVRERTAAELLTELAKRMDAALKNPGAIEFAAAFDTLAKR